MVIIEGAPNVNGKFIVKQKDPGYGRGAKSKPIDLAAALETVKHYFGRDHNREICGFCPEHAKETVAQLTEDENFVLTYWSRSDKYPVNKYAGKWIVDGIRGCGACPVVFKTKKAAMDQWERYIHMLIDKKAGRI